MIDPKEALNYLGVEVDKIENLDQFKDQFNKEFVRKANISADEELMGSLFGKVAGTIQTKIKQIAKENGVEFEVNELKDKKIEDIAAIAFNKLKTKADSEITEWKTKATTGNDERIKTLEQELEKHKSVAGEFRTKWEGLGREFEGFKAEVATKEKQFKLDHAKKSILSTIKLRQDLSEVERIGFETLLEKEYKFDFDDKGELNVFGADGKQLVNPKIAGTFLKPEEAVNELAIKMKVVAINPNGQRQPVIPGTNFGQQVNLNTAPDGQKPGRKINMKAAR